MAPRRAPDERGPFLGTEQIIKRLRAVRQPFWQAHLRRGAMLGGCTMALLMAGFIVLDRIASYRRRQASHLATQDVGGAVDSYVGPGLEASYASGPPAKPRERPRGKSNHAPARRARPEPAAVAAPAEPPRNNSLSDWELGEDASGNQLAEDDSPPGHEPRAHARTLSPHRSDAAPIEPASGPDSPATTGCVRIEIDGPPGSIFVDGKRVALDTRWDVNLSHGEHYLMVRLGGRSMTYKLRFRGAGVRVVFDDQGSKIREEAWQPPAKGS